MDRALRLPKDPVLLQVIFLIFQLIHILNIYLVGTLLKKKVNLMVEFLDI